VNCAVPGCGHPRTARGHFCNTHRSRQRRHGHAQQEGITATALAPYRKLIRDHVKRNATSSAWVQLDHYWRNLIEACEQELEALRNRAVTRWERKALEHLAAMKDLVQPREVVETVLAMYALQHFEPRRFRSDEAFRFQLVRRVLALAPVNVGSYYDHKSRRVKRVYRDLPPRLTRAISGHLVNTFGASGLHVAALEMTRKEQEAKQKEELRTALAELK
jgi:hypothetical protein